MSAPRELADVAAELETLQQLNRQNRDELRRTQGSMDTKRRELAALDLHACHLMVAIDGRRDKADRLLDEWLTMRGAEALAEALVDEDGQPAQALPHARLV